MLSGETIRSLRIRTGRTQTDLAAQVGIPASVLSAYERGRRQPGIEIAGRIIESLGYRIEFIARLDPNVQQERLVAVLRLAEALPYRARPLAVPQWGEHRGNGWSQRRSNVAAPTSQRRTVER